MASMAENHGHFVAAACASAAALPLPLGRVPFFILLRRMYLSRKQRQAFDAALSVTKYANKLSHNGQIKLDTGGGRTVSSTCFFLKPGNSLHQCHESLVSCYLINRKMNRYLQDAPGQQKGPGCHIVREAPLSSCAFSAVSCGRC